MQKEFVDPVIMLSCGHCIVKYNSLSYACMHNPGSPEPPKWISCGQVWLNGNHFQSTESTLATVWSIFFIFPWCMLAYIFQVLQNRLSGFLVDCSCG